MEPTTHTLQTTSRQARSTHQRSEHVGVRTAWGPPFLWTYLVTRVDRRNIGVNVDRSTDNRRDRIGQYLRSGFCETLTSRRLSRGLLCSLWLTRRRAGGGQTVNGGEISYAYIIIYFPCSPGSHSLSDGDN